MFTKPYMDWKYGRISGKEAVGDSVGNVANEGATALASGVALKGAGKLAEPVLKAGAAKFKEKKLQELLVHVRTLIIISTV